MTGKDNNLMQSHAATPTSSSYCKPDRVSVEPRRQTTSLREELPHQQQAVN